MDKSKISLCSNRSTSLVLTNDKNWTCSASKCYYLLTFHELFPFSFHHVFICVLIKYQEKYLFEYFSNSLHTYLKCGLLCGRVLNLRERAWWWWSWLYNLKNSFFILSSNLSYLLDTENYLFVCTYLQFHNFYTI